MGRSRPAGIAERVHESRRAEGGERHPIRPHRNDARLARGRRHAPAGRRLGAAAAEGGAVLAGGAGGAALQLCLPVQSGRRSRPCRRGDAGVAGGGRGAPAPAEDDEPDAVRCGGAEPQGDDRRARRAGHCPAGADLERTAIRDRGLRREALRLDAEEAAPGLEQVVGARQHRGGQRPIAGRGARRIRDVPDDGEGELEGRARHRAAVARP